MNQTSSKSRAKVEPALRRTPFWVLAFACVAAASLSFVAMAVLFGHSAPITSDGVSRPAIVATHNTAGQVWPTDTPDPAALTFPRISVTTLKQLLDAHAPIQLLDNSSDSEYAAAHIPIAIHFQISDLLLRQGELDAGRPVILYCNCTAEQVSISFGRELQARGFSDVRVLSGGLKAWQAAGYPTASSPKL